MNRENDRLLEQLHEVKATEDHTAKKAVSKTQIDQSVAAAQAEANAATIAANDAATAAANASDDAAAAAADAALGIDAYNGNFASPGIIELLNLDHGVGENVLNYRDVDLSWRPYDWFTWSNTSTPSPYTNNFDVWFDTVLERDAIRGYSDLNAFNTLGMRHITMGNTFNNSTRHIASIFVRTFTGRPCDVQLKVEEYATISDLSNGSPVVTSYTGPLESLSGNSRYRLSFQFTTGTSNYIVLRVRVRRTSGAAGNLSVCSFYNPMIEEVGVGQAAPSKFTMPYPRRGEISSNAIEQGAFEGYISGLELARATNTTYTVSPGAAYVPGVDKIVSYAGSTETSGTGAGVKYIYLESNADGTNGTILFATTAPDTPYYGSARTHPSSTMRRFIGCFVVYGTAIVRFRDNNGYFVFMDDQNNRTVATGSPTTASSVDVSAYVPTIANAADIQATLSYTSATSTLQVGYAGMATGSSQGIFSAVVTNTSQKARNRGLIQIIGGDQHISHAVSVGTVDVTLLVMGFWYDR